MELSQIFSYVITLLALVTSLIAWLTKLRLSKEYKEAKEAELKALEAQMNIVRNEADMYKSFISNKLIEYSKNTISDLEERLTKTEKSKEEVNAIKNILFEIEKSQKELKLKYSNNENSSLALILSHEIRTPLNAIIGLSSLLKSDEVSKEDKEMYLEIIQKNGEQLISIFQDLTVIILGIQKIDVNKMLSNKE